MAAEPDDKRPLDESQSSVKGQDRIEDKIDRDLKDSFPASDPPGWVLGVKSPADKVDEKYSKPSDGEETVE